MNHITADYIKLDSNKCKELAQITYYYGKYNNIVNRKNFSNLPLLIQLTYLLRWYEYNQIFRIKKEELEKEFNINITNYSVDIFNNIIIYD